MQQTLYDVVKKNVYDKLVIKVNAIDNKIQALVDYALKHNINSTNRVSKGRLSMLTERYLLQLGQSRG